MQDQPAWEYPKNDLCMAPRNMPMTRLVSLVSMNQISGEPSHGNKSE